MSHLIHIHNRLKSEKIDPVLFRRVLKHGLKLRQAPSCEITLELVGKEKMAEANMRFLKHEGSTDVITFPYCPETRSHVLFGDILISLDDARKQAREFRASPSAELVRYAIHGILHLLGFEDNRPVRMREMKKVENQLMASLGEAFEIENIWITVTDPQIARELGHGRKN